MCFRQSSFLALNADDVATLWKQIKQQEKAGQTSVSRLDEVKHAPALSQADEIQKNVAKIGFDFPDIEGAYGKLEEELGELKEALAGKKSD